MTKQTHETHEEATRVLVVMNRFHGFETTIPDGLDRLGYAASWCDARRSNTLLSKVLLRAGVLQRLRFYSRANIKRIAAEARMHEANTLLFVSPENLRSQEIAWLRSELPTVRILLYIYDSSANRFLDQDMIDAVDVAYSFDIDDCAKFSSLQFLPLPHHHEELSPPQPTQTKPSYDFCFIGTARVRRLRVLSKAARNLERDHSSFFFYLFAPSLAQFLALKALGAVLGYRGVLSRKSVAYEEYLEVLASSACVIDVEQEGQGGLTIRTMDAVFAARPFLTTNKNVVHHDFFRHFPIGVFSADDPQLQVPAAHFTAQGEHFFEKYRLSNWLLAIITSDVDEYRSESEGSAGSRR